MPTIMTEYQATLPIFAQQPSNKRISRKSKRMHNDNGKKSTSDTLYGTVNINKGEIEKKLEKRRK